MKTMLVTFLICATLGWVAAAARADVPPVSSDPDVFCSYGSAPMFCVCIEWLRYPKICRRWIHVPDEAIKP